MSVNDRHLMTSCSCYFRDNKSVSHTHKKGSMSFGRDVKMLHFIDRKSTSGCGWCCWNTASNDIHHLLQPAETDNAESMRSSLIESSLSAEDIIDNVNRKLDGSCRSLSWAVYTMFNSVFPLISWTLRRGLR